jgi:hypothetical protein
LITQYIIKPASDKDDLKGFRGEALHRNKKTTENYCRTVLDVLYPEHAPHRLIAVNISINYEITKKIRDKVNSSEVVF